MPMRDTYRLFQCGRCQKQIRLCRECDRGQRFCEQPCRAEQRRLGQRRAGAAYQRTRRGRGLHAARMQRYRERQPSRLAKNLAQKVTHHTVTEATRAATPEATPAAEGREVNREANDEQRISERVSRCTMCERVLPEWARRNRPTFSTARRRSPRLPTGPPE